MKHWKENFFKSSVYNHAEFRSSGFVANANPQALTKRGRAPSKKWSGRNLTGRTVGSGPVVAACTHVKYFRSSSSNFGSSSWRRQNFLKTDVANNVFNEAPNSNEATRVGINVRLTAVGAQQFSMATI